MSRRKDDVHTLTCAVSEAEHAIVETMKARCAVDSDANLVRIALWSLANEWDIDPPAGAFDCRQHPSMSLDARVKARALLKRRQSA